jgi:hypothetical protein
MQLVAIGFAAGLACGAVVAWTFARHILRWANDQGAIEYVRPAHSRRRMEE